MMTFFVAAVPAVLGGLFAAAAAIVLMPSLRMRRHWAKATGTVVDFEEFESGGETVRRVEVRFRGPGDREWTASCPIAHRMSRFTVGAETRLLFDPNNPTNVRVDSFEELWLLPSLVGGVGAIAVILGVFLAVGL